MSTLHFKPHARLLTMLGDQLIKNERIALVEIIKNAYDADASWVKVTFEGFGDGFKVKTGSKIIIEDDGTGMTKNVLEEHWISPATPVKKIAKATKPATPKGRQLQGEKGIGRFAILKLGKTVSIITRPEKSPEEYTLSLDLSHFDEDFLSKDNKPKSYLLSEIDLTLSIAEKATQIKTEHIHLGARIERRKSHGTRIEISNLRGSWTQTRVDAVYADVIRLQSIFDLITKAAPTKEDANEPPDFEVLIYKDAKFQNYSTAYIDDLRALIENNAVLRITEGRYDQPKQTFKFKLNDEPVVLALNDPDITGITLFREKFASRTENGHLETKCGSFSFGFYVFDLSKDATGRYDLDDTQTKLLKGHRIYLYRDGIRVSWGDDPPMILVKSKDDFKTTAVFDVLYDWMVKAPSVYILKKWERAYSAAKNELFQDFYAKSVQWPLVLWKTYESDQVSPSAELGALIARNLLGRMTPFDFDVAPFATALKELDGTEHMAKSTVLKVLEGERFLPSERLNGNAVAPGDVFIRDHNYYVNIRPDCDCIARDGVAEDSVELYLLKGSKITNAKVIDAYDEKYGTLKERETECIIFGMLNAVTVSFQFATLQIEPSGSWLKDRKGRLLPPYLTRLQQRYAAYLQRPGLSKIPKAALTPGGQARAAAPKKVPAQATASDAADSTPKSALKKTPIARSAPESEQPGE